LASGDRNAADRLNRQPAPYGPIWLQMETARGLKIAEAESIDFLMGKCAERSQFTRLISFHTKAYQSGQPIDASPSLIMICHCSLAGSLISGATKTAALSSHAELCERRAQWVPRSKSARSNLQIPVHFQLEDVIEGLVQTGAERNVQTAGLPCAHSSGALFRCC